MNCQRLCAPRDRGRAKRSSIHSERVAVCAGAILQGASSALDLKFAGRMLPFKYADDKERILSALTGAGLTY